MNSIFLALIFLALLGIGHELREIKKTLKEEKRQ